MVDVESRVTLRIIGTGIGLLLTTIVDATEVRIRRDNVIGESHPLFLFRVLGCRFRYRQRSFEGYLSSEEKAMAMARHWMGGPGPGALAGSVSVRI